MNSSRVDRFVASLPPQLRVVAQALLSLWDEWLFWIVVNTLWVVSWVTIVLGPPVTFGVYYVAWRAAGGRKVTYGDLWRGSRQAMGRSWLWMVSQVSIFGVLYIALLWYNRIPQFWARLPQSIVLIVLILWTGVQFYALPYFVAQENKSLRLAWRNGWVTLRQAQGYSLIVLGSAGAIVYLFVLSRGYLFFLGGFCLLALLGSLAVQDLLAHPQPVSGDPPQSSSHTTPKE